jgi:DNA-binding CsgD family transcriptional regulator
MSEGFQALSEREKETLRLLLGGYDIKSIAADLGLSVHTVNERLREARRKLGASSSRQAARILGQVEQGGPNVFADPSFSADKESGVVGATPGSANDGRSFRAPGRGHSIAWLGGGMLIMSLIIAAAVLSLVHQGGGKTLPLTPISVASVAPSASESEGSARQWLALVDNQRWSESWSAAGAEFRSHVSSEDWASKIQPVRQAVGPVSSPRVLQKVLKATSLPGAPDGQYEVLQFATGFAKKPGAIETVTLAHEPSGWKVDGYFIK